MTGPIHQTITSHGVVVDVTVRKVREAAPERLIERVRQGDLVALHELFHELDRVEDLAEVARAVECGLGAVTIRWQNAANHTRQRLEQVRASKLGRSPW